MAEPMLEVRNLCAWYGPGQALHGIDLQVREGELVTLLGRNGAGKTTTIKATMGAVPRRTGSIRFQGTEIIGMPSHRIARLGIAWCPEERGVFTSLNVAENLALPPRVAIGGMTGADVLKLFPAIADRLASGGGSLSGGEQQMLAIGRILRTGARLLLLDEPTEGLAPVVVREIGDAIRRLKAEGLTILMVEQNVRFASTVADRHYIIDRGKVADALDNERLLADFDRVARQLGV